MVFRSATSGLRAAFAASAAAQRAAAGVPRHTRHSAAPLSALAAAAAAANASVRGARRTATPAAATAAAAFATSAAPGAGSTGPRAGGSPAQGAGAAPGARATPSSPHTAAAPAAAASAVSTATTTTTTSSSAAAAASGLDGTGDATDDDVESKRRHQHHAQPPPQSSTSASSSRRGALRDEDTAQNELVSWTYEGGVLHPMPRASAARTASADLIFPAETVATAAPVQQARAARSRDQRRDSAVVPARMLRHVLAVRKVQKRRKATKRTLFSVMMCVGNGAGAGGIGQARALTLSAAADKAFANARKNMFQIERLNGRTLYYDHVYKFKASKLHIYTAPPGAGISAGRHVHEMCRCFGIDDLRVRIFGSQNPINVGQAFADALKYQGTPEDISRARGKIVYNVEDTYYGTSSKRSRTF